MWSDIGLSMIVVFGFMLVIVLFIGCTDFWSSAWALVRLWSSRVIMVFLILVRLMFFWFFVVSVLLVLLVVILM